ncbi:DUF7380 domain-containing protein, partial [Pseudorhodoplanes sp.]|uniref:DUF7380 domain-containing protein n=1 Tax=Pseudorhodoplanes sp. TaxID=1934341 RepID=UPI003D11ACFD
MSDEGQTPPVVTLAQFEACDLEGPIASINQVGMPALWLAFESAAATTQSPCRDVFSLLAIICSIHLNPGDRGRIWGAGVQLGGRRSMIPSDLRGAQSDILEKLLPRVRHPALRARIADVVWTNDLRKAHVAKIAIDAYCECVEGLSSGVLTAAFPVDGRDLVDAQTPALRALQIASAIKGRTAKLPDRVTTVMTNLYGQARTEAQPVIFCRFAQLGVEYKLVDPKTAAVDLENVASEKPAIYPMAILSALDYAGELYRRAGDNESERRCELAAVQQLLRMRDECGQAGAKASWVMDALLRLRHIKCDEAVQLEQELEVELRQLQRASMREMATFSIDIRMDSERDRILSLFERMSFSEALKSFALLESSPKTDDLKEQALGLAEQTPLSAMMGGKHVDGEGKIIVNTSAAGSGDPPEDWFTRMIGQAESRRRAVVVANSIDPVRLLIGRMVAVEERHFRSIVRHSPFVPPLQAPLVELGFARFFQGDFASAAYLLFPQLEASLRHLLRAHGADPTKRRDDATEEDRSLDAIFNNHRSE